MTIDDFMRLPGLSGERGEAERQIRAWLRDIESIDDHHLGDLEKIVRACETLWKHPRHQHFTMHGLPHSGRIVARLADWLAANRADALEPMEAFLLLGAAYLHDVGMQCVCPDFLRAENISTSREQMVGPDYALLESIRRRHGALSERMIRDACKAVKEREYEEFSLNARTFAPEAQLMAVLARHHGGPVSDIPEKYRANERCHEVAPAVRMTLLLHLLRIGDALDGDARRLPTDFLELHPWEGIPPKDQFHVLKHFCTASIERQGMGFFVFHYTFPAGAGDLKPALREASEQHLREHLRDSQKPLNAAGIALTSIDRVTEQEETIDSYPLTDEVRAEFHAVTMGETKAGRPADPTAFLAWLYAGTSHIDIRGLAVGSGKAHRFPIENLYIPLTTAGVERGARPGGGSEDWGAEEAAHPELQQALRARTLIIVGDPGAGKSTFLSRISAALCDGWMGRDLEAPMKRLGLAERPLPVLLRVAELATYLEKCQKLHREPSGGPRSPDWLAQFLGDFGAEWNWNLDSDYFRKHFEDGTAVIMLDGLDEAPSVPVREQISALVREAAGLYQGCRFVVTSRPAAYVDDAVLPGFTQARIEPLTDGAVEKFLGKWSKALFHDSPERARSHHTELMNALRCRPEIRKLARNPVMLTALAVVHWNEKRMPEQRVELYESIMKWLARSRERKAGRLSDDLTLERLAELALAMQDAEGQRKRQVPRRWAAERIAHHWYELPEVQRIPVAEKFLVEEELDSGIIVGRGQEVLFWHLTFQEYLAAWALAALDRDERNSRLLRQTRKLYATEWRETILLFAMELRKRRGERIAQEMVTTILDGLGSNASLADQARCAGLLGAILRDLAVMKFEPKDARYAALLERVMAIFDREKSKGVPMRDAIAAGEALGQAGDPRFEKRARAGNWVQIEACEFRLSETKTTVSLGGYAIGRYPVTVQEYEEFIEDGGYTDARWWEAVGHGVWARPEHWEDQIPHRNRPVVGVSWFEARAYAKWNGCRLPTEAEWERAATGVGHREYPWGNTAPDERLANYDNKVGAPSPVGVYPCGATPDGTLDMAGNVWEWCEDYYDENAKRWRVLRGGSWGSGNPEDLRCACRRDGYSGNRLPNRGFRCVLGLGGSAPG